MKYVDPDGRDIVLLLDPDRGRASWPILNLIPFGHSAALIGNDNDGWLYYSNDGPASTDVQWFDTKEKFFSSYKDNRGEPTSPGTSGHFVLKELNLSVTYWCPVSGVILYSKNQISQPQTSFSSESNLFSTLILGIMCIGLMKLSGIPIIP